MELTKKVGNDVTAGFLVGALSLTGILYLLNQTEEKAIALTYGVEIHQELNR